MSNLLPAPETVSWYQRAVIYEVHVRSFFDSDGNGAGDFRGLVEKLDYIQDLGVTAIWLLPFCPSPWRDDGYDISDYVGIHPAYGCLDDFRDFVEECRRRDLKVITELVLNHTSDQHPWFQRARRSPKGSPFRDYYVWSDTPDRYAGVRVIFRDFEKSNWTWDELAGAWYWHRFYSHQPDLNFDSPNVRQSVYDTVGFWLDLGVDGLRLDAVPYLFEREGTTCENLPETHAFLRELRSWIDLRYSDRMLLAEANQWPEDAVAYFGNGDECHMAFNFPLMPRLFMAMRTEDSFPITNIVERTPKPPDGCHWATFLRNHDELTLEMVCDEERDYMYRNYAEDPEMRINVGIRRRLAPLLENDERRIRLINALLFSLPGTPVLYYGDEIGMGEDLTLGDRNSVRTPMQWNAGQNGGFSTAALSDVYLPVISTGEYSTASVNVHSQLGNRNSLLWWIRQALSVRRSSSGLTSGEIEFLSHGNRHVLAFVRTSLAEDILVVANLSRYAQPVQLTLASYAGRVPVEIFGQVRFPVITSDLYQLSLAPYGFYWFALRAADDATPNGASAPTIDGFDWSDHALIERLLQPHVRSGDVTRPRSTTRVEVIDVISFADTAALVVCRAFFSAGDPEVQQFPLAITDEHNGMSDSQTTVAWVRYGAETKALRITAATGAMSNTLAALIASGGEIRSLSGVLKGICSSPVEIEVPCGGVCLIPQSPAAPQRNTSALLSDIYALKLFRHLEQGANPDIQTLTYLFEEAGFAHVPAVFGKLTYMPNEGGTFDGGVLHSFVGHRTDLWQLGMDELSLFLERAASSTEQEPASPDLMHGWTDLSRLLGRRTAQMHLALAASGEVEFAPESFDTFSLRGTCHAMTSRTSLVLDRLTSTGPPADDLERAVRERLVRVDDEFQAITRLSHPGQRIRIHGDLHLGQVLHTGEDIVFIDFEGDSKRPLAERRMKNTPLADAGAVLHSLRYLGARGVCDPIPGDFAWNRRHQEFAALVDFWVEVSSDAFVTEYRRTLGATALVPSDDSEFRVLLHSCTVAKAVYQIAYEAEHRPHWLPVAMQAFVDLTREAPDLTL